MGKVTIAIEVGGDVSRLHRVAEEISGLIEDAGYLVSDYSIAEEEVKNERARLRASRPTSRRTTT